MSADFLDFPDPDALLPPKDLDLDLFPDSFLAYREDSLCMTGSSGGSHTTPSTPDSSSLPSLEEFSPFSALPSSDSDCYQEELEYRAPFIPMDDDFPLLSPCSSVMWGPQQPPSPPKRIEHDPPKPRNNSLSSSLAALLQAKEPRAPPRNHVILLDHAPLRKNSPKSNNTLASQKRHTKNTLSNERQNLGSHTATVKMSDRLIKVQVSVSELGRRAPNNQPFSSPPDPPPKRSGPPRPTTSPKRLKGCLDSDSVLLNLLTSGEDASRGYLCSGKRECLTRKLVPPPLPPLLPQDGEFLDSLLCDADLDLLLDLRPTLA